MNVFFLPHVQSRQQVQSIQEVQQGQEVHGHQKNQEIPVCQAHPVVQIISVRLGTLHRYLIISPSVLNINFENKIHLDTSCELKYVSGLLKEAIFNINT